MMVRGLLALLWFYRRAVSPALGQNCRYYPSCSSYAAQAVAIYGPWRGAQLALARLARCHPWARGGVDVVPAAGTSPPKKVEGRWIPR